MNFKKWSDVANFPGVREFPNSHAFVEEIGQPIWHNAAGYFQKLDGMPLGKLLESF